MFRFISVIIALAFTLTFTPASAQERAIPQNRAQVQLSFAPLVKKVAPAVVNIYAKRVVTQRVSPFMGDPFFEQFFGQSFGYGGLSRQRVENSLGSGVIIQPDGLIITNSHVAADAEEIKIVLPDGREFEARKALVDKPSDLALLRIDPGSEPLPYVSLEPSENLEVGDMVLAIGNPFGVGQTVTSGIVSALARSSLDINDFNFFIQTDAAINPGNSGGALVDMNGGLVGINTAIFSRDGGSLGIGFAIPSEMVATVIAAEKSGQDSARNVVRAWMGIGAQKITKDIADSLGLRVPGGVLISSLHKASPARKAGLEQGDVVTAVNGKAVNDPAEMKFRMATLPIGGKANFSVLRKGKTLNLQVEAIAPPDDPPRDQTVVSGRNPLNGATVANLNPAVAAELDTDETEGVIVVAVDRSKTAARVVEPGEVVLAVNNKKILSVADLRKALRNAGPQGMWSLILERDGQKRQIVIR